MRIALRRLRLFVPTSVFDVIHRSAIRIGFCGLPYLLIAHWSSAVLENERLLNSWGYWWCVVAIPVGGFLLDLWRLQRTRLYDSRVNA